MFEIQTFTAQADLVEDRIRLDAVSAEGGNTSIRLTRRLADRFLPLLVEAVERSVRPGIPREIELAMAQQQLRIDREENPIPDVLPVEGCGQWLCLTIHLESRADHLLWTLTDEAENTAIMALPGPVARSVLEVFLLVYRQLEWVSGVFPAWLTEEVQPDSEPRILN